ncbi:TonB-dependent receptor [Psychroserpens sp.]|uniref:TonB-dependent receptor n=1 Tax=Psychroserpens sp. TaxID=2020870 RepID=UPI001B0AC3E7|nr:TonB-dependent receptor [Psychroserpens sp.]MBO6606893.1 TonB-dependent receptor [Psychroserpens sp.]MBO6654039.1 TonB-dependent receptor [Psychroserpens sp.]MBO6682675.1 TonB-dependent receptor [Psychroserpens sp.]MBO6750665.1 TonB-dependent receptor [Psychroserpens sp.]MBO6915906.1 TonB-dependent receptor [Psychroserpens sp.]
MKKTLIFLVFLVSSAGISQEKFTVSGTLKDQTNGETLLGATIYLKGTSIGTTTNEYGFYSLTTSSGNYTLIISYLGYRTIEKTIELNKNLRFNAELEEDSGLLDEIIITTKESKKVNLRSPQMSVSKLSSQSIKQIPTVLGEVDVIKSLQLLPGVANAGEGASGFNVRGGAEDQNLVLLDEAIIYNASHLFGFFSVFNVDAIKDVKLYKGGIPSRYGGRVSSVLDIRQKDGNSKAFKISGGIGAISSRLAVEGPTFKDKGSFLLAGRASYADLFLAIAGNENRAGFYDLNLKTNYELNDKNRFYLSGYFGNDNFELSNFFNNSYGNLSGNLRWNHIFNDKLFSNLSLIYSRYNYNLEINAEGIDWTSDIDNYNLKYDFGYYLNDKLTFDFGVSGIYYDFNPGELNPLDATSGINPLKLDNKYALEAGAYIGLEHKLTDRLTAQYGLRYSYFNRLGRQTLNNYANDLPVIYNEQLDIYERADPIGETNFGSGESIADFGNFEPRFALAFQLNDNSSLKASYNRIAQYLHLISNTTSATPLDVWTPSGKFIDPQLADQFAVGYFRNFKDDMYSIETEAYFKTVDNRIDYIDGADLIAQNTIETEILIGESRAYGLELLLRKNKGDFTGWLAYTLSKSEQRTPGGNAGGLGINNGNWYNTNFDRTHDISFTGSYKLNDKWRFGTNFVFQTGRPVTYPNGQFQYNGLSIATYSNRNANRLPAYHRLDISATLTPWKNKNRKWQSEWVFGIYNIYNRKNAASITFGQNQSTGANEATRTAIFGIIPSISYNFKF